MAKPWDKWDAFPAVPTTRPPTTRPPPLRVAALSVAWSVPKLRQELLSLVAQLPQRAENKKNFDLLVRMLGNDAEVASWSPTQKLDVLLSMAQVYARTHAAALPYYLSQQLRAMPIISGGAHLKVKTKLKAKVKTKLKAKVKNQMRSSPRRASPQRSSPHCASPRRASPRRASPRRASPRR
jgi:hypothetical protein